LEFKQNQLAVTHVIALFTSQQLDQGLAAVLQTKKACPLLAHELYLL
jgi:hypothetical protein